MRLPFHWEGPTPELPSGNPLAATAAEALAVHFPDSLPTDSRAFVATEHSGGVSARETREQMARDIREQMTDGSPAAREWAERKAATALRRWDRGVSDGTIHYERT